MGTDLTQRLTVYPGAGFHNSIYRGKFLGNTVTPEQYAAIANGTFDDLYIGDYWIRNGIIWRIAAFNYFLRCGDTDLTKNHVVIVPGSVLYSAQMNATNTTAGGYVGSLMRTEKLEQAKISINMAFPGHVMKHRQYLTNAVTNGRASGGAWLDCTVELMSEIMVCGSGIFSPVSDGATAPVNHATGKSQLPLFALRPDLIGIRASWWLRDVITNLYFANISYDGLALSFSASTSMGVCPFFSITGEEQAS